jgi:hypothetical protein
VLIRGRGGCGRLLLCVLPRRGLVAAAFGAIVVD